MKINEVPECEGPLAHLDLWNQKCPRCGVWQFRRNYLDGREETNEEFRERIKKTLDENK